MLEALVGELTRKSNWFEQNVPILCENKPAHWLWLIGFWLHTLVNLFNFLAKAKNLQDKWGPHTHEGWKKSILLHRFSCLLHALVIFQLVIFPIFSFAESMQFISVSIFDIAVLHSPFYCYAASNATNTNMRTSKNKCENWSLEKRLLLRWIIRPM